MAEHTGMQHDLWQPIETAPEGERIIVDTSNYGVTVGILRSVPYNNRGGRGWRVSVNPAEAWRWTQVVPKRWMRLPNA